MTIPLALVAARARNGVIGRDGAMPWRLPAGRCMVFSRESTGDFIKRIEEGLAAKRLKGNTKKTMRR